MSTTQELEELLDRAVQNLVIRRRGQLATQYSVASYRQALQEVRRRYAPDLKIVLELCDIEITDPSARDTLLNFLRTALQEYIHEDRIQTAGFAIRGGPSNGFPIDYLTKKLLELTVALGSRRTAALFAGALATPTCRFQEFTLLGDIKIGEPIELYDGVRIEVLPTDKQTLPSHLPMVHFEDGLEGRFQGGALLVVEASVTPRFMNPQAMPHTLDADLPFRFAHQSRDLEIFNAEEFCNALSLAAKTKVYPSVQWRSIPHDEVAGNWGIGSGYSWRSYRSPHTLTKITDEQVGEAKTVYESLAAMTPDARARLSVPIDRLIESWGSKGHVDQIIDLAIALESLYLPEHDSEMSYRLRNRGARFLEADLTERRALAGQLKTFYTARSRAVHTGKIPDTHKIGSRRVTTSDLITMTQEVCLRSIRQVIDGGFPDWDTVELS
ncbi:MAG: hypothetical protein F4X14_09370 [Caldilineaceae bacterium SB0661_bin_32]|uniref:Uncharacterized protein n=1 Tax=Caldilineaceae bacterium SB0661_bin_32 TaxID=2605255 RepID=A0A6B1D5M8_9CHLR|nr:hypothetical protein [Caldilineaceae bacterium SB0661_bin_32]